ncbi:hypothetical protein [Sphingobium lactosutens]|uniref:Uncharacterized protein n=1 Tax=Sphingobium lactosutens DS20 TaxID=1331060 RepID=T0IJK9_9SPHN|nr:hypothetical protein [Sphingobium lactosutens]EQB11935.1 hypothetical protein RLDS_22680 [Sphingobium lactosutens DS20]
MQQMNGLLHRQGAELVGKELARWLPKLRHIYTANHKLSAKFPGTAPEKNIAFRKEMHEKWRNASAKRDMAERIALAKHYVSDWGGVKSNNPETLERYSGMRSRDLIGLGMQGVSSWSKIISIHSPRTYPIYDARVALSLNAIQAVILGEIRVWFRIPSTQIKTIPVEAARLQNLCIGASSIPRKDAYKAYLAYLNQMGLSNRRQRTEMLLFAASPTLVDLLAAIPTASFNSATLQALLPTLRQTLKV